MSLSYEKYGKFFTAAILVLVLALNVALALLLGTLDLSPKLLTLALAAAAGGVLLLVLFHLGRFEYAILGMPLAAGLTNFFSLPTGTESRLVLSLLLALGLIAVWVLQLTGILPHTTLRQSRVNRPILTFVLMNVVAFPWAMAMRDPLVYVPGSWPVIQLAALSVNIGLPLIALLVANKITEMRWLRALSLIVVGLGILALISERFELPTGRLISNGSRGLFAMWVCVLAYSLAVFDTRLRGWQRILLLLVVAGWIYQNLILKGAWLSGWVPLVAACGLVSYLRSKWLALGIGLLMIAYVALNFNQLYLRIVTANVEEGSLSRLDIWEMNLAHVKNHPVLGMGPAGYAVYNMAYHPQDARSTHNNYFDILAQSGILGFSAFLWLFATFIRLGKQACRAVAGQRDFREALAHATLAGTVGALVGMLFGDWVLPFAYNQTISGFDNALFTWLFLGAMVSLYHYLTDAGVAPTS